MVVDNTISIPAGEARHKEIAYIDVPEGRCCSTRPSRTPTTAATPRTCGSRLPDGKKKQLLAMPRYDFNWQRDYTFAEPMKIPAGSKLIAHYWLRQLQAEPGQPGPEARPSPWGDQSWEEMFYTAIRYRWLDETSAKLVDYDELMDQTRLFGMFDDNMDGKIQKAELKGELGDKLSALLRPDGPEQVRRRRERRADGGAQGDGRPASTRAGGQPAAPAPARRRRRPPRPAATASARPRLILG